MESERNRFLQHQQPTPSRSKRWGGCLSSLSCFGSQKGRKRIVPASRIPEANGAVANQPNGPQAVAGLTNQNNNTVHPSLLAPPSSPASFSNSALPSTVQSPSCFLSVNSPGGPSSTMFATGPYAHETQLVSPPVFSNFTTEPSTAPFTPPPELAHLTTPSSPDVPYAHFLSSKGRDIAAANDLHATYSLYPGSPASSTLRSPSPISRTPGEGLDSMPSHETKSQDANFFCPETFAQYYLDQSSFPHSGGRLSVSKESDVAGNVVQNRQSKVSKQDVEELEAYRASFGFSADEIVSTAHYVEISDVMEDSFSMVPPLGSQEKADEANKGEGQKANFEVPSHKNCKVEANLNGKGDHSPESCDGFKDVHCLTDDEEIFSKMGGSKINGKYRMGLSSSDAEMDYRRGRSLREGRRVCSK